LRHPDQWVCAEQDLKTSVLCSAAQERQRRSLLTGLAAATAPVAFSLPVAFLLANVLIDKTSMMGVLPPPLGPAVPDIIIGAVIGLSAALAAGSLGVWLAALLPQRQLRVGWHCAAWHVAFIHCGTPPRWRLLSCATRTAKPTGRDAMWLSL